jgi:VWFA-related protein
VDFRKARPLLGKVSRDIFVLSSAILVSLAAIGVVSGARRLEKGPTAMQSPKAVPTVRVRTRLVQVNVIVNDKHGSPMTGLDQKDFSVLDNGVPQEIQAFSSETSVPRASPPAELSPGTYTNRPEEQTKVPASVTVILLDALNTEAADQTLARKQVIRALKEVQPQEYVALYWLGNGLRILHDFTTDASLLRQVLAGYDSKTGRELDNGQLADPSLNTPNPSTPAGQASERQAFRLAFDQRVANQSTRDRVRATVAALIAIANHLGTRPGRKSLVWVSSSFPISVGYDKFDLDWANDTGDSFAKDVRRAAQILTDSDIAVYPVDARGLLGTNITSAGQEDFDSHIGDPNDTDTPLPARGTPETFDTMRILAERTGGKAFYGTNNISGAIRRAMDDSRVTYTLAYSPARVKWDGSFREIKVKVAVAGAEVRARSGYFALPDMPAIPAKNDHALIAQLAASWLPATGIGLHVSAKTSGGAGTRSLEVEARLDLHEIKMTENGGRRSGMVRSVFLQLDSAGHVLKADDRTFPLDFDAPTYERVLQNGMSDTREISAMPNAAAICVVVRDASSSRIGSIYLPLTHYFPDALNASGTRR